MDDDAGQSPEKQWWVIQGGELMEALRRAHAGGDPDMIYLELFANSTEREAPDA